MQWFHIKSVTLTVALCFLFYSIVGCGGSNETTRHLDKYDDSPYRDVMTVSVSKEVAYRAVIASMQQRGYVVTLSDPQTGLVNTEINSSRILPEEQKLLQVPKQGPSVGKVLLVILSIVLVFGIVLLLVGSSSDKSKDDRSSAAPTTGSGTTYVSSEPAKTTSYKYIVTLNTSALTDSSTQIQISAVRMELENGSVKNSGKFESKYLNYSIFDALYEQLNAPQN